MFLRFPRFTAASHVAWRHSASAATLLTFSTCLVICVAVSGGCSPPRDSSDSVEAADSPDAAVPTSGSDEAPEQADSGTETVSDETGNNENETDKTEAAETAKPDEGPAANQSMYSPEAFRKAAHDGKLRIVEVCLESGMDVNSTEPSGLTPLMLAAYNGHDSVVNLLLKKGAKIGMKDGKGNTALIYAASGPFPTTVRTLLDAGADIDRTDSGEGFTALMTAAGIGNTEVVKVLVERGADKTVIDVDGDKAIDFARKEGHSEIVAILE